MQKSCEQTLLEVSEMLGNCIGFHELDKLVGVDQPVVEVAAEQLYVKYANWQSFIALLDEMVACAGRPRKWAHLSVVREALWIAVKAYEKYPALDTMGEKVRCFWQHEKDEAKKRAEKEAASEQQVATTRPSAQLIFQAPALASTV